MWIIVNVNCVPVPQPSSVSVYLRVKVKSTIYVNPRLLVPGLPVQHRDRIIHHTRWSSPASAAHRARRLQEVCRCPRLARARHRSRQTEARWCLCWLRPAHLLRRWSCPACLHWFRPVPRYPSAPRYPWVC